MFPLTRLSVFINLGDVEIGLMERNGGLEVEVVQARGLTMKPGSKGPPGQFSSFRSNQSCFSQEAHCQNSKI